MAKRLTGREMYDLAWSQPMRTLATTFGILNFGADAFRKAREIRTYVEEAREADRASADPLPLEGVEVWPESACAQAGRLDPVLQGASRSPSLEGGTIIYHLL